MKRHLLSLVLVAGVVGFASRAQAQDKPVLNSAPPGLPTPTPRPVDPTPVPATPEPAPPPEPTYNAPTAPVPQPTPDAPSGLSFPNRATTKEGGAEDQPPSKKFLYANFGLGFASSGGLNQFNASISPAIGFRLTNKFAIGPGISYAYSSYSLDNNARSAGFALNQQGDKSISSNNIGLKAFAQYIVYKEFFLHAEYEVTNAQLIDFDNTIGYFKYNRTIATPLAGIGYRSYLGEKAAADIVALYNFDNSVLNSLYPGLVIRFSFLFNIGK